MRIFSSSATRCSSTLESSSGDPSSPGDPSPLPRSGNGPPSKGASIGPPNNGVFVLGMPPPDLAPLSRLVRDPTRPTSLSAPSRSPECMAPYVALWATGLMGEVIGPSCCCSDSSPSSLCVAMIRPSPRLLRVKSSVTNTKIDSSDNLFHTIMLAYQVTVTPASLTSHKRCLYKSVFSPWCARVISILDNTQSAGASSAQLIRSPLTPHSRD